MEVAFLFAPLYAGALIALVVAAWVWGRPHARAHWPAWPWVFGAVLVFAAVLLAVRMGVGVPVALHTLLNAVGVVLGAAGLAAGIMASRGRKRAELLVSTAPVGLDEAIARARKDRPAQVTGVFRARIANDQEVTSPGGVVCAFYEAELREPTFNKGRRGRLISTERAFSDVLWIRGDAAQVPVAFGPETVFAPEELRRTTVASTVALSAGRALADGDVPIEAVSHEKLGRLGETCLVMGRLVPGPAQGSYLIQPAAGSAATVILGEDTLPVARRLIRKSWALFAVAVALLALSAWCLAR